MKRPALPHGKTYLLPNLGSSFAFCRKTGQGMAPVTTGQRLLASGGKRH
jgi:hypothetical protein